ncbi:MAG: hypothetical protein KC766_28620 [Myxococcales bacterium]|nr:hypothetical protein [Myxococcales bacterium]
MHHASHSTQRHPTTRHWRFPPSARPALPPGVRRLNLRELAARPRRFEHHLVVLGRAGDAQLELATASEPLYFSHGNISDEYAISMNSGDALFDSVPFRTFFADRQSGEDLGRINHRSWDLVLHPHGYLHWPGRLRPPFTPPRFPGDERRTGLSLVYCGYRSHPPHPERPLSVSPGREDAAKSYGPKAPPFHLVGLKQDDAQLLGRVDTSSLELLVQPREVVAPRGGYLCVVTASGEVHAECDLLFLPPGTTFDASGIERALWFSDAEHEAEPPTQVWEQLPEPDFLPFEEAEPGSLPFVQGELKVDAVDDQFARVSIGERSSEVPRYWLARFLFRLGLHGYQIGYLETYGGFFYDDQGGHRLGVRGLGAIDIAPGNIRETVERLYRAVAPPGYVERLS